MNIEQHLIKVLLSKEGYDAYRDYVDIQSLESNMSKIVKLIDKLFNEGTKEVLIEDLKIMLGVHYPSMKDDVKELIFNLLDKIDSIDGETILHRSVMQGYKNKQMAAKLGQLSLKSIDNPELFNVDELKELINKYELGKVDEDDGSLREFTWDELLKAEDPDEGVTWFTERLTEMCGRLKGGSVTLIIATPDTGKSAFCHTCATHFAETVPVLHINNEERDSKVALRARCSYTEMTVKEMLFNKDEAKRRWGRVANNWKFRDNATLTFKAIRQYIEQDKPKIIFIDQATKISVKEEGRHDLTLTAIFKELREIAKECGVDIIGVSQADANAYQCEFIKLNHVANSNIGIQGEIDTLIGLVRKDDGAYVNVSVPKAKESGNSHLRTVFELDKRISRMKEV